MEHFRLHALNEWSKSGKIKANKGQRKTTQARRASFYFLFSFEGKHPLPAFSVEHGGRWIHFFYLPYTKVFTWKTGTECLLVATCTATSKVQLIFLKNQLFCSSVSPRCHSNLTPQFPTYMSPWGAVPCYKVRCQQQKCYWKGHLVLCSSSPPHS